MNTNTHSLATMAVSAATFREILLHLRAAKYDHAIHTNGGEIRLDMHGIALVPDQASDPDEDNVVKTFVADCPEVGTIDRAVLEHVIRAAFKAGRSSTLAAN